MHLITEERKLQPKLRMIANGDTQVNTVRAEQCGSICVSADTAQAVAPVRSSDPASLALAMSRARALPRPALITSQTALSSQVNASVFIQTVDTAEERGALPGESARRANLATAVVNLADLNALASRPEVTHIELGEPLAPPTPTRSPGPVPAPPPVLRQVGHPELHHDGEGVLIGIIDVEGFDFAHPDFLNADGTTRFERIWDQGGTNRPGPATGQFHYGSEITAAHMNAALAAERQARAAGGVVVPAVELEPQSQMEPGSHGTHVASIAAGNLGVARKARLAGVLISLPKDDLERRKSFYDSARVAHAIDYLLDLARQLRTPCVLNVSLGTNGHAHDGSAAISRWIDAAMSTPGRGISVAAGNAGQERAEFEGDTGYVVGRIHTSGQIASAGLVTDIEWIVVGNGITDLSENELELWFAPQDRIEVSLKPPGQPWTAPMQPQHYIENRQLPDGSFFSVYNELYHPANGGNYIAVYLSPKLSETDFVGVAAGKWLVRLKGIEIRDGRYHGWIERDDPRPLGRIGEREAWNFPSFFSERSNVDNSSVSSLACGNRVMCVANLEVANDRVALSSSQGPTRDNRCKPDVAAPGTDIVAASGFSAPDELWVSMSGTSMASPYVAGVMGLMLAVQPKLTAAQLEGIMHRTARPLPDGTFTWANTAGFGAIDPEACVVEAASALHRTDQT